MSKLNKISFSSFNLKATLDSGQVFRYRQQGAFFIVQHGDWAMKVRQCQNVLFFEGKHANGKQLTSQEVVHFFRLDETHSKLLKGLASDKHIEQLSKKYRGIHLIRQDLYECIISFMCSSAANIPKIKVNVELLSRKFGRKFELDNETYYTFPKPGALNNLNKIKSAKAGFRSSYIFKANKMLTEEFLERLSSANYNEAKEMLLSIHGIGEKIANCISLFGLGHTKAFPVDTWMRKTMLEHYDADLKAYARVQIKNRKMTEKDMSLFGQERFGESAGLAQQYLFVHARSKKA